MHQRTRFTDRRVFFLRLFNFTFFRIFDIHFFRKDSRHTTLLLFQFWEGLLVTNLVVFLVKKEHEVLHFTIHFLVVFGRSEGIHVGVFQVFAVKP